MATLFDHTKIKSMRLRNRFVRSATGDNYAELGYVSEKQIEFFKRLAKGRVGLIITGMTAITHFDQIRPLQNSIASDYYVPSYKILTDTVHKYGAKIAIQLVHTGRERARWFHEGEHALAPSVVKNDPYFNFTHYRVITEQEIWDIIKAFGDAAERAKEAGFDTVQVHSAYVYLLMQFLSPYTNRRKDKWGGSLENRLRIHFEVYKEIRKRVGDDYPILLKLGVQDGFVGGLKFEEGKKAATILAEIGFDSLEIAQGLRGKLFKKTEFRTNINSLIHEAYFRQWCMEVKQEIRKPVIIVGGLRTFALMEEIIRKNEADYVSLCRPFIREPDIIIKWKKNPYYKVKCVSCNKCLEMLRKGEPLCCIFKTGEKEVK